MESPVTQQQDHIFFSHPKGPNAKKTSISILVLSLPLLYVSILRIPPSSLFKDTTFLFLLSNSIILLVAADSGVFSSSGQADAYYNRNMLPCSAAEPAPEQCKGTVTEGKCRRCSAAVDREVSVKKKVKVLPAAMAKNVSLVASSGEEGSEYCRMSDEELNRRVEEFIRRFNREIMLQRTSELS